MTELKIKKGMTPLYSTGSFTSYHHFIFTFIYLTVITILSYLTITLYHYPPSLYFTFLLLLSPHHILPNYFTLTTTPYLTISPFHLHRYQTTLPHHLTILLIHPRYLIPPPITTTSTYLNI